MRSVWELRFYLSEIKISWFLPFILLMMRNYVRLSWFLNGFWMLENWYLNILKLDFNFKMTKAF